MQQVPDGQQSGRRRIAVVVPILNEASGLPDLLAHLAGMDADEVLLVDGGSSDGSRDMLESAGASWLAAPAGRASQMNAGARHAKADILLFLHADTRLPAGGLNAVRAAMSDASLAGGRFDVRLSGHRSIFRLIELMINLRSRLTKISTGDQVMFVRRNVFEKLGGFPEQPLMEDVEFSRRLKRIGGIACLRQRVCTSSRRWEEHGIWRTVWLMWRLRWRYWLGASAADLKLRYSDRKQP
ncbi:MAG: TIGR04283 family arsenosugar biosynthesis glycosyltransferase [Mariprofundaceae bacterium]